MVRVDLLLLTEINARDLVSLCSKERKNVESGLFCAFVEPKSVGFRFPLFNFCCYLHFLHVCLTTNFVIRPTKKLLFVYLLHIE